jgi:hypothetical protein
MIDIKTKKLINIFDIFLDVLNMARAVLREGDLVLSTRCMDDVVKFVPHLAIRVQTKAVLGQLSKGVWLQ